jgi:hypothetical protein
MDFNCYRDKVGFLKILDQVSTKLGLVSGLLEQYDVLKLIKRQTEGNSICNLCLGVL